MASTSRFVPNPAFASLLKKAAFIQDAMQEVAETIAENAQGLAPVDQGDYKAGIEAVSGGGEARVNANWFTSGWIEFGSSMRGADAPLRRGVEQAGLRVEGS